MNNRIILPETDNYYLLKDPIKGICLIANKQYEINDITINMMNMASYVYLCCILLL